MKRTSKLISILLTFAMLVAMVPAVAVPVLAETAGVPDWASSVGITDDYAIWDDPALTLTLTDDVKTTGAIVIPSDKTITIDLAGHVIDRGLAGKTAAADGYVIKVEGYLTVTDSGATPRYGKWNNDNSAYTLTTDQPASGTYDTFATGGVITGGKNSDNGGGVYVDSGTLTLSGGAIVGNRTNVSGGGVFVIGTEQNPGSFTMTGGAIVGNQAGGKGGGVYVSGGSFTMRGSAAVSGNYAGSTGGGVYVGSGSFTMSGDAAVRGNTSTSDGGGVYMHNESSVSFFVSGNARVTDNVKGGMLNSNTGFFTGGTDSNVYLYSSYSSNPKTITVAGALDANAAFGITVDNPAVGKAVAVGAAGEAPYTLTASDVSKLSYDSGEYSVVLSEGKAVLAEKLPPWQELQAKLNAGGTVTLSENVYATADDAYLVIPDAVTVTLDLAGHVLSRNLTAATKNGYVIKVQGNLYVIDSDSTTIHSLKDQATGNDVTVKGGVITGGNSYGGTDGPGGGIYVNGGSLTLSGGTVFGNHLNPGYGGGVYVARDSSFTMSGGAIAGNRSGGSGGGVYVHTGGTFTMSGGVIAGNKSSHEGGGVCVNEDNSLFKMTGGAITGNTADTKGGGVYVAGGSSFTMTGGTITGNTAKTSGGGVYKNSGTFTMTGGAITGNTAKTSGGGVYVNNNNGTFNVSGDAKVTANVIGGTLDNTNGLYTGGTANNVDLPTNKTITVAGTLTGAIGVTAENPYFDDVVAVSSKDYYMTDADVEKLVYDGGAYAIKRDAEAKTAVLAAPAYTVTFLSNGGTGTMANQEVPKGASAKLAANAFTRTGYDFTGWNTAANGSGSAYADGADVTLTADLTLYAQWKQSAGGNDPGYVPSAGAPTTYAPTVEPGGHGSVKVSPEAPREGEKATVTLTPDEGYEAESVTVTGPDGKPVELTKNADGTYSFTQPRGKVSIKAAFAEKKAETPAGLTAAELLKRFPDLDPKGWYLDNVRWAVENGVMQGTDKGFEPDQTTSRGMIVTILYRLEGEPVIRSGMPFSDVKESDWYAKAVSWAESLGIVNGYEDGTFRPGDPITREQLAAILYRYAQYKGKGFQGLWSFKLDFPDAGDVSDWATEAVSWMVMNGVVGGKDGFLAPGGNASRAEAAAMLQRFCEKIET